MSEFKVGDRVRVTGFDIPYSNVRLDGRVGTAVAVFHDAEMALVAVDDDPGPGHPVTGPDDKPGWHMRFREIEKISD